MSAHHRFRRRLHVAHDAADERVRAVDGAQGDGWPAPARLHRAAGRRRVEPRVRVDLFRLGQGVRLMADQEQNRNEAATPFKLDEARRQGNVPKSLDFNSFAMLAAGTAALYFWGGSIA